MGGKGLEPDFDSDSLPTKLAIHGCRISSPKLSPNERGGVW